MVVGYFLYELPLFGYAPSLESAVTTNLPQAAPSALWPVWRCSRCSTARILRPV